MGAKQYKGSRPPINQHQLQFQKNQWLIVQPNQHLSYELVKNTNNEDLMAQIWVIKVASDSKKTQLQQLQMYAYRKQCQIPIVKFIGYQNLQKKSVGLCGKQAIWKVMTERIVTRWNQFPQLTLPQCLYVLKQSFIGFRQLQILGGVFDVTDKMIGMNSEGLIKFWLNQNYGENRVETNTTLIDMSKWKGQAQPMNSEKRMIISVLHIIQEKCQQGRYPHSLRNQLYQSVTFQEANTQLSRYVQAQGISIPKKLHANLNYILEKKTETIPTFGQYSLTQPYHLKNTSRENQEQLNKVVNFVNLKPPSYRPKTSSTDQIRKNSHNKFQNKQYSYPIPSQRISTLPSHPSQLRGNSRIVHIPKRNVIRSNQVPVHYNYQKQVQGQGNNDNINQAQGYYNHPNLAPKHPITPKLSPNNQVFNYLKTNPHIMTVESIYQPVRQFTQENKQISDTQQGKRLKVSPSQQFLHNNQHIYETKYILVDQKKSEQLPQNELNSNKKIIKRPISNNSPKINFNYNTKQQKI